MFYKREIEDFGRGKKFNVKEKYLGKAYLFFSHHIPAFQNFLGACFSSTKKIIFSSA